MCACGGVPLESLLFFTKGNKTTAATCCVRVVSGGGARSLPLSTFALPVLEHRRAPGTGLGHGSGRAGHGAKRGPKPKSSTPKHHQAGFGVFATNPRWSKLAAWRDVGSRTWGTR